MRRQRTLSIALCALVAGVLVLVSGALGVEPAPSAASSPLTPEKVKQLKNPVPYSKASLARGRILFIRECTECHGNDGKSQVDVIANATDLTQPKLWTSGTTPGEIFRSIRDGAGDSMPPFKDELEDEDDVWHLVNFMQSLWPAAMRPKLQAAAAN